MNRASTSQVNATPRKLGRKASKKRHSISTSKLAESGVPSSESTSSALPRRVLLIDDDLITRMVFTSLLKKLEANVDAVASPTEALRSIDEAATPHDLIICDLHFENDDMSGIEFASALAERKHPTPFLLASSDAAVQSKTMAHVRHRLQKPIDLETFRDALEKYSLVQEK